MALATAHVEIVADTSRFKKDLQQQLKQTGTSSGKAFSQAFNRAAKVTAKAPSMTKSYSKAGKDSGKSFAGQFNKTAGKSGKQAQSSLSKGLGKRSGKKLGLAFGKSFASSATAPISVLGKGTLKLISSMMDVGMGADAKTFGIVATSVGALVAAVAPLAGYLAGLPALLAGVGVSAATAAVAFQGMGDAISAGMSGDMEEFKEALDGLQPAAAGVAKEIVGLKPAFDQLQNVTQQAFFAPLVGSFEQLDSVIRGPIQAGMRNLANALGMVTDGALDFFTSDAGMESMQKVFDGIADSARQIAPAMQPFLQGLTDIAANGAGSLGGIGDVMERMGTWMSGLAADDKIVGWLEGASHAASQLGAAMSALKPSMMAIGSLIGTVGENVRQTLIPTFDALGGGMQGIIPIYQGFFDNLGTIVKAVMPIFGEAFEMLGKAIGAILSPALQELEPIFENLSGELGPKMVELFEALTPKLVAAGEVIGSVLVQAITALTPVVRALVPVIKELLPVVEMVFTTIVTSVKGSLELLSGIMAFFGNGLVGDWRGTWEAMKDIGAAIWGTIVDIWVNVWNRLNEITRGAGTRAKNTIMEAFANAGEWLVNAGRAILDGLVDGMKSAWGGVTDFVGGIGDWIQANKGPLSYDRTLLIPAGMAIMRGFQEGLERGWSDVASTISGFNTALPGMFPGGSGTPFDAQPVPLSAARDAVSTGVLSPAGANHATTSTSRTTTVGPQTYNVYAATADPHRVARRTASRIASMATA